MRTVAGPMLAVLLVAGAVAQDSGGRDWHAPRAGDYVGEAGGALLGGVLVGGGATFILGLTGAALLSSPGTGGDNWGVFVGAILGGAVGATLGYPLGCGLGTTLAGQALRAEGNTGAAYVGAYAGLLVGACLAGLGAASQKPALVVPLVAAGVLSPPVGAVLGYNSSGGRQLSSRFAPSMLAYRTRLGPDRQRCSTFDCRLVTVRF